MMMKIIKLLRRVQKKYEKRDKTPIYDICLVKKSSHGRKIYEKLGVYSVKNGYFRLNIFRLIFWLSKDISMTGNFVLCLINFNILRSIKKKKWLNPD